MMIVLLFSGVTMLVPRGLWAAEKEITITAVGDCLITDKVSNLKDPGFLKLVEIMRKADCTYGNCETPLFDASKGFPAYKKIDPNQYCQPWGADEFKWMGIDLMSLANNHVMDFDYDGMFETLKHLDRVGIKYAGAGQDLDHAAMPGYFDTPSGPVALISCCSWLPEPNFKASLAHPYMKGRPGTNGISSQLAVQVNDEIFARLRQIRKDMIESFGFTPPKEEKDIKELEFDQDKFVKGDTPELLLLPEQRDLDRIIESVKIAARNSRMVIVSLHEHLGKGEDRATKFQEDFARSCIDAGADMFVATGPHVALGIEIYKGKPIFHSIGNLFFQENLRLLSPEFYQRFGCPPDTKDPTLPSEEFGKYFQDNEIWESIVPFITFDGENKVKSIELYPIVMSKDEPIYRRGTPRLAEKEKAREIIERVNERSKYYKTTVTFREGKGRVVL
jgi:poly-gamma-glutamate synthesis protein (capsule biosynthesis protein)